MKKIISVCFLLILALSLSTPVFADEILDSKGNIIPCKIETVEGGLIEYKKAGSSYSFIREKDSLVFNDYIDVRDKMFKNPVVTRYSGKIIVKDAYGVILQTDGGNMNIPWYRVKFVGIYKGEM